MFVHKWPNTALPKKLVQVYLLEIITVNGTILNFAAEIKFQQQTKTFPGMDVWRLQQPPNMELLNKMLQKTQNTKYRDDEWNKEDTQP